MFFFLYDFNVSGRKEAEEQFVLSELTEYIQGQYREEQIDWTVYQYRRHLIKVIKYCVNCGILNLNDGSEENFARDDTSEVLYENYRCLQIFYEKFHTGYYGIYDAGRSGGKGIIV